MTAKEKRDEIVKLYKLGMAPEAIAKSLSIYVHYVLMVIEDAEDKGEI